MLLICAIYWVYIKHIKTMYKKIKEISSVIGLPVVLASLCCLSPLLLVIAGVSTVAFAASLTDIFYGDYKWWFRLIGLLALIVSYVMYIRRQGVCTIDEFKKRQQEIINKFIIMLVAGILGYIFFLYVVVHYVGVWFSVWE